MGDRATRLVLRSLGCGSFGFRACAACALAVVSALFVFTPAARADTVFTVTSTLDDGSAGTLRWAIGQANAAGAGTQTISFLLPSGSTITLTSALPTLNNSTGSLVINGVGASGLTISGNDANRVFFVQSGTVSISNLNVDHAVAQGGAGGADPLAGGGGGLGAGAGLFVNQGANVTIKGVTFNQNSAVGGAGGTLTGSGVAGGGGGGGLGGNGGNGGAQGGGGGGGLRTNGGAGGVFGGGGGGGLVGNGSNGGTFTGSPGSPPGGNGGDPSNPGAAGGPSGGGGGGGTQANGGAGGDFGGGGGSGPDAPAGAGNGGFGGGGGGSVNSAAGAAGFGAGAGGAVSGGNGGSGYGGAVFVRQGGTLSILDSSTSGNAVSAGAAGSALAANGQAAGQDLYLMTGVNAQFGGASNLFSGSISGDGGVTIQSTVNTTFSGLNTYTGGTTVSSGTLTGNTSSLQGDITNNSEVIFNQTANGTYAGNMTGTGSLLKMGTADLVLSGTNSVVLTTVQEGRLAVNGTLTSDVDVLLGAVLGGNGTINGDVSSLGTVGPGNSIGTLTVNGNYHIGNGQPGAVQQVQINAGGNTPGVNNDLLVVNGTTTINGATVDIQAAPGTYAPGTRYTFLETTARTGTYAGISGFNLSNMYVVLGYGDLLVGSTPYETAYFTISDHTNFASVAGTFNQLSVATYIDTNSTNPTPGMETLINELASLSVPQQQAALASMAGEVNGTLAQLQVQDTSLLYAMLRRQVGAAFPAGGAADGTGLTNTGSTGGSLSRATITPVSFNSSSPQYGSPAPADTTSAAPTWGGWTIGYGMGGDARGDGNAAGGTYGSGGTIVAIERPLDENTLTGFFGGYSGLSVRLAGLPQSASANQGQLGGYLFHDFGCTYTLAATSTGFAGYQETRLMNFGGVNATANGSYHGWSPSAYLEQGTRVPLGSTLLQPYAALQYIYLRQNSFTETGAGTLNQTVDGIDTNSFRSILGSRLSRTWRTRGGYVWVPELRAAWMHEFLEPSTTLNATFAPVGGASFAAQGLNFGRDWALLGAGTQFVLRQNISLFANYDLQTNANQTWHAGSGGLQVAW